MTILGVVITLIVVGVLLWLVQTYVPMAAPVKQLITAVVMVALVLWLLTVFFGHSMGGALNRRVG